MDQAQADYMGMIATVMKRAGPPGQPGTPGPAHPGDDGARDAKGGRAVHPSQAIRHLEKGRVVIFRRHRQPLFTTDTAAALRAAEIEADAILKGTHSGVDGVYSADPKLDPAATRYEHISYIDVINQGLKVMDATAIVLHGEGPADRGVRPARGREHPIPTAGSPRRYSGRDRAKRGPEAQPTFATQWRVDRASRRQAEA